MSMEACDMKREQSQILGESSENRVVKQEPCKQKRMVQSELRRRETLGSKESTYRTVQSVMRQIEGIEVRERRNGKFYFPMYLNQRLRDTPIEALELSVRSYNVLKRSGHHFVGELAEAICEGMELKKIRGCGAQSVREIMERLFLFQYDSLRPEAKERFLLEVVAMNVKKRSSQS